MSQNIVITKDSPLARPAAKGAVPSVGAKAARSMPQELANALRDIDRRVTALEATVSDAQENARARSHK